MIIVDTKLQQLAAEGKPIRVGLVGAGFMARGIARQIMRYSPGMRLVGVANRTVDKAIKILKEAGCETPMQVSSNKELTAAYERNTIAVTHDATLLTTADEIDVICEVTGALEYGASVIVSAIDNGKHVVSMNAEVDGTIGSILKKRADAKGVIYTLSDGDQPGVQLNLYRYVKGLGMNPVVCGNIKGLHDPYRTPETQAAFAAKWGQNPAMVTSFADGSKISYEQACVANALGMQVAKRGMHGYALAPKTPVEQVVETFDINELTSGPGIVDYVVGAEPNGGVFVLAAIEDSVQQHYLNLYKVGEGPLYCFYAPYHLCHFETPSSIARAVLFQDATLAPLAQPTVEVITAAKKDLKTGETIDPIGHFMTYGLCENSDTARKENLLPLGLAEGCVLKKDIAKDACLTLDDVERPAGRLIDQLWEEQFPSSRA